MQKGSVAALFLFVGLVVGSLASLHAEKERYSTVYDVNGTPIHVGDVIVGSTGVPIKVHGFTVTYRAGTFAAYSNQVHACPKCNWVETAPLSPVSANVPRFERNTGVVARVLSYFDLLAADDDQSIVWGS